MTLATPSSTAGLVSRIWLRDTSVFLPPGAPEPARTAVRQRLGWLDAPLSMGAQLPAIESFAAGLRGDDIDEMYLLGMGGSSLCAEVLRDAGREGADGVRLTVLDTTDEAAIAAATSALRPPRAGFIVASKSGSTIEVTSLERHFRAAMTEALGANAGRHFIAITDPGTPLAGHAATHAYRQVFLNPPDIGGRFSALSLFGLVPAALLGMSPARLLASGRTMAEACRIEGPENPGLALGTFMAESALAGRDKLTIVLPARLAALGAWIEQLVAESTGKDGRGLLPVLDERLDAIERYGHDRAFVVVSEPGIGVVGDQARALQAAGHPVFDLPLSAGGDMAAEFFRWEFATAVTGAGLGVNPFDEPNVREAKERTARQLEERRRLGRFRLEPPLEAGGGFSWRVHHGTPSSDRRYVAMLDYLPADEASRRAASACSDAIRRGRRAAVTHGIGPRYLHSTGQYHKGGPNTGVFVLLTADDRSATPVAGTDYTFSALKQAQALGDFEALAGAGRHVLHYHFAEAAAGVDAARAHLLERLNR
jgi:hypothetical protein